MKNGKKILLITACAVLLVVASVMGTLAYLTDSESVKNTFTVGSVGLRLDEAKEEHEMRGKFESPNRRKYASKMLVLMLAVLLIVGVSVGGTLAWLQATTGNVQNTFTSAELFADPDNQFTIWEHQAVDADAAGKEDGIYALNSTKVTANTYDVLPGVNIPKNPTVGIDDLEENAYLYLKVTGTLPAGMGYAIDDTQWVLLDATKGLYYYKNMIEASDADKTDLEVNILQDKQITVADTYSGTADNITLSFEAYMVQATGNGADAAEAWVHTYGTANP